MTLIAMVLAEVLTRLEETFGVPNRLFFVYGGSPTGARTLLGAVASSMIGVAGTVFSVTIAALSLASGQMGPRLLNNFTEDKGNQYTLGVFISTFAFSLYTLRTVQGGEGDSVAFVPHYGVTVAMVLAALYLGMLVYYIHHISSSINIARVTGLLRNDMRGVLDAYTLRSEPRGQPDSTLVAAPGADFWTQALHVHHSEEGGYLQTLDTEALLRLAVQHELCLLLEVRAGDYVFPFMRIARVRGLPPGQALPFQLEEHLMVGPQRSKDQDPEYVVWQLADIATRALSRGTNDPLTAVGGLDQFGDALCRLKGRDFPSGVHTRGGQVRLVEPGTSFGRLTDQMFQMVRQYGADDLTVVLRMLDVLTQVASVLVRADWRLELVRHAELMCQDVLRGTENPSDRHEIETRFQAFKDVVST